MTEKLWIKILKSNKMLPNSKELLIRQQMMKPSDMSAKETLLNNQTT
jgi:hypothetical protein